MPDGAISRDLNKRCLCVDLDGLYFSVGFNQVQTMENDVRLDQAESILKGFKLPPQPHIFAELKRASPDLAKMATVVERDPAISASVLKVVNSPAIGLRNKVSSVSHAMSLLGIKSFMNIINAAFLKQTLSSYDNVDELKGYWLSSNKVAIAMASIARQLSLNKYKITSDDVYCIGLFHNVGVPMLLDKHPEYLQQLRPVYQKGEYLITDVENHFFDTNHTVLGFYMTKGWGLPKTLSDVIKVHHDFNVLGRLDELDEQQAVLLSTLKMAELIACESEDLGGTQINYEWAAISADILACMGLSSVDFLDLIDSVGDEVEEGMNDL